MRRVLWVAVFVGLVGCAPHRPPVTIIPVIEKIVVSRDFGGDVKLCLELDDGCRCADLAVVRRIYASIEDIEP